MRKPEFSMPGMELLGDPGQCASSSKDWWVLGHSPCLSRQSTLDVGQALAFLSCSWMKLFTLTVSLSGHFGVSGLLTSLFSWAGMSAFLPQKHHIRNLLDTNSPSACLQTSHGLFLSSLGPMFYTSYKPLTFSPQSLFFPDHFLHNLCPSHSFPITMWLLILWELILSSGFIVWTLPTSHEFCHCIPLISLWFLKRCFGVLSQFLSLDLYKRLGVERDHWPGSRETWSVEGETRGEWAVLNAVSISYQIK